MCPSGGALATMAAPMVPVAPALLSVIKVPPNFSWSLGARVRAIKSVEPPGGNGTMMVTGLSGQAHAVDRHTLVNTPARNLFIVFLQYVYRDYVQIAN